jgi:multiple antibiotic resistance protein
MVHNLMGSTGAFFITSLVSLLVIIDPPGNVFPYLALAGDLSPKEARDLARRACLFSFLILIVFTLIGRSIIEFFGISLPAFQITGGLILFRIAFDMLEARGTFRRPDLASKGEAKNYRDMALVPLAVPMLSGPGAIATVLVLASRATNHLEDGLIILAVLLVLVIVYLAFVFADKLLALLKESGIRLLTRIMGLILAALAVEFVLQGIKAAFPALHQ